MTSAAIPASSLAAALDDTIAGLASFGGKGAFIGRDAVLTLELDADNAVWVGGDCRSVLTGELQWP